MRLMNASSLGAAIVLLTITPLPAYSQDAVALEHRVPRDGTLAHDASERFTLELARSQFASVSMRPDGARMQLSIYDAEGALVIERRQIPDNPARTYWLVADRDTVFTLELRNMSTRDNEGRYRLVVDERRLATDSDRKRVHAQALHFEAVQEFSKGTAESRPVAIAKFEDVRRLWRDLGDDRMLAEAVYRIGFASYLVDGPKASLKYFEEVVELYRKLGDRVGEARTLDNVGLIRFNLGEPAAALDIFEASLPVWRSLGHRQGEANGLLSIGLVKESLRDMEAAARYYSDALAIQRDIGDERGQGVALNNLAHAYHGVGDVEPALEAYTESLALRRALGDMEGEAVTLNNIAIVLFDLGEVEKATSTFEEALALRRKAGDRRGEATTLQNVGIAWRQAGHLETSRAAYESALAIARELQNPRLEGGALHGLGTLYALMGDDERAERSHELGLAAAQTSEDPRAQASNLTGLGRLRARAGDLDGAITYYENALDAQRAGRDRRGELMTLNALARVQLESGGPSTAMATLETARSISDELAYPSPKAETLRNLGLALERSGESAEAARHLDEALLLFRQASDRSGEADALFHRARMASDAGELAKADALIGEAIDVTESLRGSVAALEYRSTFLAARRDYYGVAISNALRFSAQEPHADHVERALLLSERSKARSLLDALRDGEISGDVAPDLRAQRSKLERRINAAERAREELAETSPDSRRVAALSTRIADLLAEHRDLQAAIRQTSPRYSALMEPALASVDELRENVLDDETLLIEFELGDERSVAWVLTNESLRWHSLPPRAEIETAARRAHELLSVSHRREASRAATRAASALSRMVLAPLVVEIGETLGRKRIVVVADGALHYVPFGALPQPGVANAAPLSASHEVVNVASASVLVAQRRGRRERSVPERAVAVFADPVFRQDDERLDRGPTLAARTDTEVHSDLLRSARESGTDLYGRLTHTSDEAAAIRALADGETSLEALGFAANRDVLLATDLSRFRILHFATHGILNSRHPELSGIVLSLVDENGAPVDGFLRTHEIANLDIDAELVVVSACRTALGREIRGEGIVGLARAFTYAGASSVLATLWDVRDTATAALMTRFYRYMLRDGQSPPAALREAQEWMRHQPGWQAPYYWAGFVLQGDWK